MTTDSRTPPPTAPDLHPQDQDMTSYHRGRADGLREALIATMDRRFHAGPSTPSAVDAQFQTIKDRVAELRVCWDSLRPSYPPEEGSATFRAYYNQACARIIELETQLKDELRQSDEATAILIERVAMFVQYCDTSRQYVEIADEIREGRWRRFSSIMAKRNLVDDGRFARSIEILKGEK